MKPALPGDYKMNQHNQPPVIGYTITTGNPAEGFGLYGFFPDKESAITAAEHDRTMPADWWLLPIYKQD